MKIEGKIVKEVVRWEMQHIQIKGTKLNSSSQNKRYSNY